MTGERRRTRACSPTPLRGRKIGPILKHICGSNAESIYFGGAADAQSVGRLSTVNLCWCSFRQAYSDVRRLQFPACADAFSDNLIRSCPVRSNIIACGRGLVNRNFW
jgi:hypothetical protein